MQRLYYLCEVKAILILFLGFLSTWYSAYSKPLDVLVKWQAGSVVSIEDAQGYGLDSCFMSQEISTEIFNRIYEVSYKKDCTVPIAELRYIRALHYNDKGELLLGEMICHRSIADDLVDILRELFQQRYPIERMVLVDNYGADDNLSMLDNNSSAFNYRYISGTQKLSNHSYGLAVDINPLYNPYVRYVDGREVVEPRSALKYVNRKNYFPYMIVFGDACHRAFTQRGFRWGGSWRNVKDYQHFEKKL